MGNAKKILTDSGGVQKQAFFLKVPCVTLRNETEWVETVKDGWNVLVGADVNKIKEAIGKFDPKGKQSNHFGDGDAAGKIVNLLERYA
jgi:UDP-GlcNAc3NAcA epimerase